MNQKNKVSFESKVIEVHVKPNSKNNSISFDEEKKVYVFSVKAPAEDGKANAEIIKLIKKESGKIGKIISGATSRKKLIKLE
jgi:uncharacterized protein (TIGR00251 family)